MHLDPSTREIDAPAAPTALVREAVEGFSYDARIAEELARASGETMLVPARVVALLYDFAFSGTATVATVNGARWYYLGCVRYR